MLQEQKLYDADAHVELSPRMWETLDKPYFPRRPRPVWVGDNQGMGTWNNGWLVEGQMHPHPFGPGSQPGSMPRKMIKDFSPNSEIPEFPISGGDLSDPEARLRDLAELGIDIQFLFPTTLYARMTSDPGFEAALYRAYNRYMGRQCKSYSRQLKWAALLPLRDARKGCEAVAEMVDLGASAAVVFGTVGDRLLSNPSFMPVWDEFSRTRLPLCVHMGMSYSPFEQLSQNIFDAHIIGMCLPALLAFAAIVGHGMLDRYPELKVAFLEFGAEWILYMVGRMDHYLPIDKGRQMPVTDGMPRDSIKDYAKSGRIFVGGEADDVHLLQEIDLLGENQILYSSDFPHPEARENSAKQILVRTDLTETQKRNIFYDNAVRLYGEP
jgi:predicted TIM-barrel fold metal-dependent hydrolase